MLAKHESIRMGIRYLGLRFAGLGQLLYEPGLLHETDLKGRWRGLSIPTACCTLRTIVIAVPFAVKLADPRRIAYVAAHEALHWYGRDVHKLEAYTAHGLWGRPFIHQLANQCADARINTILNGDKIGLWPGMGVDPEEYCRTINDELGKIVLTIDDFAPNTEWELAYKKVLLELPPPPEGACGGDGGEVGEMLGRAGRGAGDQTDGDGGGGGGGNELRPEATPDGADPTTGVTDDSPQAAAAAMAAAAETEKRAGRGSSALSRALDAWSKPQVDWRTELQDFTVRVTTVGETTDWRRPVRSLLVSHGVYVPRYRSEAVPPIGVGIDVSGSIRPVELRQTFGELCSLMEDAGAQKVSIWACDAQVVGEWHIDLTDTGGRESAVTELLRVAAELKGGGGTLFQPVFEAANARAKETGDEFCAMIYFTDGYPAGWPDETIADYPVLWCITTQIVAPWGRSLYVNLKE
jgi:hypothetical protein